MAIARFGINPFIIIIIIVVVVVIIIIFNIIIIIIVIIIIIIIVIELTQKKTKSLEKIKEIKLQPLTLDFKNLL